MLIEVSLVIITICSSLLFLLLFLSETADRKPKAIFHQVTDRLVVSPEFRAILNKKLPPPVIIEGEING